MAELRIRTVADVSSGKAAISELSAAEAALLAKEKEANQIRRQEARALARERLELAKKTGTASKQEIKELRAEDRIAASEAQAAAREVAMAKKQAQRAARDEAKRQWRAEQEEIKETIRSVQEYARELRKLQSTPRGGAGGAGGSGGGAGGGGVGGGFGGTMRQRLGKFGRFAGPGAAMAAAAWMGQANAQKDDNQSAARQSAMDEIISAGAAQTDFSESAREGGMSPKDIKDVLNATSSMPGVASTAQLAAIATAAVESGETSVESIKKAMRTAANPKAITKEQGAWHRIRRQQRDFEVKRGQRINSLSEAETGRLNTENELALSHIDGNTGIFGEMASDVVSFVAGRETQNEARGGFAKMSSWTGEMFDKVLKVRVVSSDVPSTQPRPLTGD